MKMKVKLSPPSQNLLWPLLFFAFWVLDIARAIPGTYFTSKSLGNKWLPNPLETVGILNQDECLKYCVKHPKCNGYAVSGFERKCHVYNITSGTPPVKNNGYVIYVKKKTEEEGYYAYNTEYIKLVLERKNAIDAARTCRKEKGSLVSVRNEVLNKLLEKLLTKHSVWTAFIGVSRDNPDADWKYADTGAVTFSNWEWNGRWPRINFHCAIAKLTINGVVWRHANCWHKNYFFCQIPMF